MWNKTENSMSTKIGKAVSRFMCCQLSPFSLPCDFQHIFPQTNYKSLQFAHFQSLQASNRRKKKKITKLCFYKYLKWIAFCENGNRLNKLLCRYRLRLITPMETRQLSFSSSFLDPLKSISTTRQLFISLKVPVLLLSLLPITKNQNELLSISKVNCVTIEFLSIRHISLLPKKQNRKFTEMKVEMEIEYFLLFFVVTRNENIRYIVLWPENRAKIVHVHEWENETSESEKRENVFE